MASGRPDRSICGFSGLLPTDGVLEVRLRGRRGFHGASLEVDPDISLTPWLRSQGAIDGRVEDSERD